MRKCTLTWVAFAVAILVHSAGAARVAVFPADNLVLNSINPSRGYFDLVVPTIAIQAGRGENLRIETVRLELVKGKRVLATRTYSIEDVIRSTKNLASQPIQGFIDVQFVGAGGFKNAMGAGAALAAHTELHPGEVAVLTEIYFALDDQPDRLRVVVMGNNARADEVNVPVCVHRSPLRYRFPLRGNWLAASTPGLQSHHRFNAPAEFAVDFFKVDADGHTFHADSAKAENWYAYGQPVAAAADGVVVAVVADQVQDRTFLTRVPGESDAERGARVGRVMEERLFGKGSRFPDSIGGNSVTIRHEKGGVVEYTSYGHLKTGSIRVKPGDYVTQGQMIAEVGDTGDTPVVHLHFQVNAGLNPFNAKSLPFEFEDLNWAGATRDPGHFVEPNP